LPVLGLIFLRFAHVRFLAQGAKLAEAGTSSRRGNRVNDPTTYHAAGVLYLPPEARFDYLLAFRGGENIGAKASAAMRAIEDKNPQLADVLPKTYNLFTSPLINELLNKPPKSRPALTMPSSGESTNISWASSPAP